MMKPEKKIPSPKVSSLWPREWGRCSCTTGTEGSAVPQRRTPAAGFPQCAAAVSVAGSPTSARHLWNDSSALVVAVARKGRHYPYAPCCLHLKKDFCLAGKTTSFRGQILKIPPAGAGKTVLTHRETGPRSGRPPEPTG